MTRPNWMNPIPSARDLDPVEKSLERIAEQLDPQVIDGLPLIEALADIAESLKRIATALEGER